MSRTTDRFLFRLSGLVAVAGCIPAAVSVFLPWTIISGSSTTGYVDTDRATASLVAVACLSIGAWLLTRKAAFAAQGVSMVLAGIGLAFFIYIVWVAAAGGFVMTHKESDVTAGAGWWWIFGSGGFVVAGGLLRAAHGVWADRHPLSIPPP